MFKRIKQGSILASILLLPFTAQSAQFSIVVLSDSQFYSELHPEILEAQIDWIVANEGPENIIYVAQLGDLKDDQLCDDKTVNVGTGGGRTEWMIVDQAFSDLDTANIPYGVVPGNHDFDPVSGSCPNWTTQRPLTEYNADFGPGRFGGDPFYGGNRVTGSNEDNYTLFESNGVKFIAINLAFKPAPDGGVVDPELDWADALLKANTDRIGIITSHNLMEWSPANTLSSYGQEVYDALSDNPNLIMMLAGHWYGEGWVTETTGRAGMEPVQVMMSNYQDQQFPTDPDPTTPPNTPDPSQIDFTNIQAGNDSGGMRIMRFDTATGMVDIETFIPPVVPIKNRTGTIVSTHDVVSGAGMSRFTMSNLSFSYLGYATLANGFDIYECDSFDGSGTNCTTQIGVIGFPATSGTQSDGTGFTLSYNCTGTFCDSGGYTEDDIIDADWTINGSGDLTALTLELNTDPNCGPGGTTPFPCSQTSVQFTFAATNLTTNTAQGGGCDTTPSCISGIAINGDNLFDPQ